MPKMSAERAPRGRRAARWGLGSLAALLLLAGWTASCRAELSVGLRFGWTNVSDEVFSGSGKLGGTNLIGAHLAFGLGPRLELEVAGEHFSKEFDFSAGLIGGLEAVGDGEWEDLALYGSGRVRLIGFAFLPLDVYGGGGLNVHWIDLALEHVTRSGADAGAGDLDDAIEELAGERSELGWHVLGGVRLALSGSALSVFAEARHMRGFDTDRIPASSSIYLGAALRF